VQAAVIRRIDDPNWAVRPQVAASLGALPSGQRETVLASVLERFGNDPLVLDAALSGLRGSEDVVLEKMLESKFQTSAREAAIVMLTATVIRARQENAIQSIFQEVIDGARPAWQRSALMRGAEVALLGAPMPDVATGAAPPARGTLAAASVRGLGPAVGGGAGAGGRGAGGAGAIGRGATAVPGSAPAFPGTRPRDPNGRPAPTGTLRLRQQPVLAGFAASDPSELASRAALLLERIEWPGKPGVVLEAPLTGEESARFDAGRRVYINVCQVCHQQDGRGQDKVAATLVGSPLALARAEVTTRILLNGKEGTIGLMPAVGAALSDDDIAAVLTYIRREWGQTGSPVAPATVKSVRAQTVNRRTPWTNAELLALNEGGAGRR
jgi:mono/diheme cytochrome c family protein